MKKFFSAFFSVIFVLAFLSCGKKGELLPPLIRIPQPAKELQLTQKADSLFLSWKNPTVYEDGNPLPEIEKIELWVLEEEKAAKKVAKKEDKEREEANREAGKEAPETQKEEFRQKARLLFTIEKDKIQEYLDSGDGQAGEMRYEYKLSLKNMGTKKYTFGLRVKGPKRFSAFSDLASFEPLVLSLPPEDVTVALLRDRIEVRWKAPSQNIDQSSPANLKGYNIYRMEGEESRRLNENLIKEVEYSDKQFVFGHTYTYFVRASATESAPYLESDDSKEATILAEDTFPPAPPKGLISVAGQGIISLSWDPNAEDDLDGYRVWRLEEGENDFVPVDQEIIKENAYIDRDVERGRKYSYYVTALDKAGNESEKSEIVSDRIRE